MKTLVVYDSAFGNTERVAQAIGRALGAHGEVQVLRVSEVGPEGLAGAELLIVGSPTQRFRPTPAMSDFLARLPADGLKGVHAAAFDTRIVVAEARNVALSFFVRLFGPAAYAAKHLADGLEKRGGTLLAPPEGFFVGGTEGPLKDGELERAARWAERLAQAAEATSPRPGVSPASEARRHEPV